MTIWQRLFGAKASEARIATSMTILGQPQTTPANYEQFARQGYQKSAVVFACISKIAEGAAGVRWCLYQGKGKRRVELEEHPLLKLLARPNPLQGQSSFFESYFSFFTLDGNSYLEAVGPRPGATPRELYVVRPDRMKVVPGSYGFPSAYEFVANNNVKKRWEVDFVKGKSQIMHSKTFNPTNDWYGQSPLEAAMLNLDQSNAVNTWNSALLRNMATPSGVLQVEVSDANPTGTLETVQYNRLKNIIDSEWSGAHNAGRPKLLEGGLKWTPISLSPKDMEFIQNKNVSARDLALVFGVPPMLLGIPGDNTYSNYKEARCAFFEETVIPLLDFTADELNNWLSPAFGEDLYLEIDKDDIEALAPKREARFTSLQNANWLSVNEKRQATDYEPKEGWDVIMVGNTAYDINQPFEGQNGATEPNNPASNDGQPNGDNLNGGASQTTPAPDQSSDPASTDPANEEERSHDFPEGFQAKAVNLITPNEKRKSWRQQNQRRKYFEHAFALDVKDVLADMTKGLHTAAMSASMQTLEYAVLKSIQDEFVKLEKVIEKHSFRILKDFGSMIIDGAKSEWPNLVVETKSSAKFNDFAIRYAKKRAGESISTIKSTTQKQVHKYVRDLISSSIEDGMTMTEVADQLTSKFTELSPGRARTIARTETTTASQFGSLEAAKSLGIPDLEKEWVSAIDTRSRDDDATSNHVDMDGQRVGLEEKFSVPPDADMEGPGDPAGGAAQVCNCRCVLVYKRRASNGD